MLVLVPMLTSTVACIATEVAYIACGDSTTGTQLAAVSPPGSLQSCATGSSSTGIAPDRYMHASFSGVAGTQSSASKLAPVTIVPSVPRMRSATRLSSRTGSLASTTPEPLTSVNGAASVIISVASLGAAPAKSIDRFGPPGALLVVVPASGSKLAALAVMPQISPASQL